MNRSLQVQYLGGGVYHYEITKKDARKMQAWRKECDKHQVRRRMFWMKLGDHALHRPEKIKRIAPREAAAIIYYRTSKMQMSISHIAKLCGRSTRTIHRILCKNSWIHKLYDKRRIHPRSRRMGEWWFQRKQAILSWFLEAWKDGLFSNIHLLTGETAEGKPP